jgi:predicted protein tyrosine phosphatase
MNPVSVLSLKEVKQLNPQESIIRISVTDWDLEEHVTLNHKYVIDSLCLEFCDVTLEETKKESFKMFRESLFTIEQAHLVIAFLKKHVDVPLVVNCYAGVSRSAAIGKMACHIKGVDDSWICLPKHNPNPYVLELLHQALNEDRALPVAPIEHKDDHHNYRRILARLKVEQRQIERSLNQLLTGVCHV